MVWGWGWGYWGCWALVGCLCLVGYQRYTEIKHKIQLTTPPKKLIRNNSNRIHNVLNVNNPTANPHIISTNIPFIHLLNIVNIFFIDWIIIIKIRIKLKIPTNFRKYINCYCFLNCCLFGLYVWQFLGLGAEKYWNCKLHFISNWINYLLFLEKQKNYDICWRGDQLVNDFYIF